MPLVVSAISRVWVLAAAARGKGASLMSCSACLLLLVRDVMAILLPCSDRTPSHAMEEIIRSSSQGRDLSIPTETESQARNCAAGLHTDR